MHPNLTYVIVELEIIYSSLLEAINECFEFIVIALMRTTNTHTLPNQASNSNHEGKTPVIYAVVISHIYTTE
jgi:ABC-type spermidine/putrescine transport system permease subunit II